MKKIPERLLKWRRKQKRGAIMKPETFARIRRQALAQGFSPERATKIAGKAYWKAAKAKFERKDK